MNNTFDCLYSKEVIKHLNHPQNMGIIKNPSGVGTVGNKICGDIMRLYIKIEKNKTGQEYIKDIKFQTLGCLPPIEEIVSAHEGWKKIETVKKDQEVINSDGQITKVVQTYIRKYKGPILTFKPFVSPFNTFSVTPNHPILAIKRDSIQGARRSSSLCKWLRIKKEALLDTEPSLVCASNLKQGDYLVFIPGRTIVDNKSFTADFMLLLGYYLAEGYVIANSVINFSFGAHEDTLIQEVLKLIFNITNKKASQRTRNGATKIRFCSVKWARSFIALAGSGARNKSLSQSILDLPFKKQWKMVKTYMLGDGDFYKRRNNNSKTYRITTTSKKLAVQIQEILARGGIFASIREVLKINCQIQGRKLKDSIQYLISFKKQRNHKFVHQQNNYFLVPIKSVEKKEYNGLVYNFQTAFEPNTYLVRGFVVHNCGAAIASTSILTTLVKGKLLKEAAKITKGDLIKALGGLPKIKIHCSLLADEAFKKALQDFSSKQS